MSLLNKRLFSFLISLLFFTIASAQDEKLCGAVDYTWASDGLTDALDYVVTLLEYVVLLCFSIAAVVSVVSTLQIYIKMQTGDTGIKKEMLMVFGGLVFILLSAIVMPGFFGLTW